MASTLTRKKTRKVSDMTVDELRALIGVSVEEKLTEMFGDPDAGLELRPEVAERLRRQEKEYAAGKRGRPLEDVLKEMGL